jgi:hypothetical protein
VDAQKVFIHGKSEAVIRCSSCGQSKTIDVSKIKHIRKPIKVKCGCSFAFNIVLEERKYYRKPTNLQGYCSMASGNGNRYPMVVENVSRTGLGFVLDGKTLVPDNIKVDEKLEIEFRLDNQKKTLIKSTAIVRFIRNNYVGAEFCSLDEHIMKELGFYLMP